MSLYSPSSSSSSPLHDGPFSRAMWLWGRDALILGQLPPASSHQLQPKRRLLDVGCGAGLLALTAAAMGFEVVAIDLSPLVIRRLTSKLDSMAEAAVTARICDGQTLESVDDASVDVVASVFGIFLFPDRGAGWAAAARVLVPGGRLLATSWDLASPHVRMFRYLTARAADRKDAAAPATTAATATTTPPTETETGTETPAPNRTAHAATFRDELQESGFVAVRVHSLSHPIAFASGKELVDDLMASEWVASILGHKDPASLERTVLDYVQLVLDGEVDPFAADAATHIRVDAAVPAEHHPLWREAFALPACAHVAVATKP